MFSWLNRRTAPSDLPVSFVVFARQPTDDMADAPLSPPNAQASATPEEDVQVSTPVPALIKCSKRGCKGHSAAVPLFECYDKSCEQKLHVACHVSFVLDKNPELRHFDATEKEVADCKKVVCTKLHWRRARSVLNRLGDPSKSACPWDKDGPGGEDDDINSQSLLLSWLKTGDNHSKCRGDGDNSRKTKIDCCKLIADEINSAGVCKPRSAEAVQNKILTWEDRFKKTHLFVCQTGKGIKSSEGPQSFNAAVKKRFPLCFELEDTMLSRSTVQPQDTSDRLFQTGQDTDDDVLFDGADTSDKECGNGDDVADQGDMPEETVPGLAASEEETPDDSMVSSISNDTAGGTPRRSPVAAASRPTSAAVFQARVTSPEPASTPGGSSRSRRRARTGKKGGSRKRATNRTTTVIDSSDEDEEDRIREEMLEVKKMELRIRQMEAQSAAAEAQMKQDRWDEEKKMSAVKQKVELMRSCMSLRRQGFHHDNIVQMLPDMAVIDPDKLVVEKMND